MNEILNILYIILKRDIKQQCRTVWLYYSVYLLVSATSNAEGGLTIIFTVVQVVKQLCFALLRMFRAEIDKLCGRLVIGNYSLLTYSAS